MVQRFCESKRQDHKVWRHLRGQPLFRFAELELALPCWAYAQAVKDYQGRRSEFSEKQLFETIAGISYSGDPRMVLPGENRGKVGNIVRKQGPQFRELYCRLVTGLPGVHWPAESSAIQQDTSPLARVAHLKKLPPVLLKRVRGSYASDSSIPSFEGDEVAYWKRIAGDEELPMVLRDQMRGIVRYPATVQTLKGVVSGGPAITVRYSLDKLTKWWAGIKARR